MHHWGSHLGWGLTCLLLEKVSGSFDFLVELGVVLEEALDVLMGQVNEHTSDLGGELGSLELGDEIEDSVSNLLLHVRVGSYDGRDELDGVSVEQLFGSLGLSTTHRRGLSDLAFGSGHIASSHSHVHIVAASLHRVASVVVAHVVAVSLGSSSGTEITVSSVVVTWVTTHLTGSSLHVAILSIVKACSLVLGEVLQELDELVLELILGGNVVPLSLLVVHFFESLEAHLILALFVSDFAEFLELVVADLQLALVDVGVVKLLEGGLSLIGGLEADESVSLLHLVNGEHFDALDLTLTVSAEKLLEVLFGGLRVKVLDVQVASLLGVLVLDGLAEEFSLAA